MKHSINYPYSFFTKSFDNQTLTFKVYFTDNEYTHFKLDENNEIVLLLSKHLKEVEWNELYERQFHYYYQISQLKQNKGLINSNQNFIKLFNEKYVVLLLPSKNNRNTFEIINKKIYLHLTNTNKREEILTKAIIDIATPIIKKRVNYWAKLINVPSVKIVLKDIETCFAYFHIKKHLVTFALMSLTFDKDTFDYLIIHELCHYYHHNHQQQFWLLVAQFCPEYKKYEKILKNWL